MLMWEAGLYHFAGVTSARDDIRVVAIAPVMSNILEYRGSGLPAGENATAEERPLQRTLSRGSPATETGGFADGVQSRHGLFLTVQHPALQVGL